MAAGTGTLPADSVRAMFDRIAGVYDVMNTVMTAGLLGRVGAAVGLVLRVLEELVVATVLPEQHAVPVRRPAQQCGRHVHAIERRTLWQRSSGDGAQRRQHVHRRQERRVVHAPTGRAPSRAARASSFASPSHATPR